MCTRARVALLTLVSVAAGGARAATWYVAPTGNDAWSGLCATWDGGTCGPKRTIQPVLDAAAPGDVIQLADGEYTGLGNEALTFQGKDLTLRGNGPQRCILRGTTDAPLLVLDHGETRKASVEGICFTGAPPC